MGIFRELVFKVHPDINGSDPIFHTRMVEVNKFRTNEDMLIKLARSWGYDLKSIPPNYNSFNQNNYAPEPEWLFRVRQNKIYEIEKIKGYAFRNAIIKESGRNVSYKNEVHNPEWNFGLLRNISYDGSNVWLLIKNSKAFKVAKLLRTTAKCVYVWDELEGKPKRYNNTSVFGRRIKLDESWY